MCTITISAIQSQLGLKTHYSRTTMICSNIEIRPQSLLLAYLLELHFQNVWTLQFAFGTGPTIFSTNSYSFSTPNTNCTNLGKLVNFKGNDSDFSAVEARGESSRNIIFLNLSSPGEFFADARVRKPILRWDMYLLDWFDLMLALEFTPAYFSLRKFT